MILINSIYYSVNNYDYLEMKPKERLFGFQAFSQASLNANPITKEALSKKMGIQDVRFDYALPQQWLNRFVDDMCPSGTLRDDYYALVTATTFSAYHLGVMYLISGCVEIQQDIMKDHKHPGIQ